ncbi:hypothetical protein GVAV_002242 [Gurleya vavrai]
MADEIRLKLRLKNGKILHGTFVNNDDSKLELTDAYFTDDTTFRFNIRIKDDDIFIFIKDKENQTNSGIRNHKFVTDECIKNEYDYEASLQRKMNEPSYQGENEILSEVPKYNQIEENKRRFGIDGDYDESIYTNYLDKESSFYLSNVERARRIEKEIMSEKGIRDRGNDDRYSCVKKYDKKRENGSRSKNRSNRESFFERETKNEEKGKVFNSDERENNFDLKGKERRRNNYKKERNRDDDEKINRKYDEEKYNRKYDDEKYNRKYDDKKYDDEKKNFRKSSFENKNFNKYEQDEIDFKTNLEINNNEEKRFVRGSKRFNYHEENGYKSIIEKEPRISLKSKEEIEIEKRREFFKPTIDKANEIRLKAETRREEKKLDEEKTINFKQVEKINLNEKISVETCKNINDTEKLNNFNESKIEIKIEKKPESIVFVNEKIENEKHKSNIDDKNVDSVIFCKELIKNDKPNNEKDKSTNILIDKTIEENQVLDRKILDSFNKNTEKKSFNLNELKSFVNKDIVKDEIELKEKKSFEFMSFGNKKITFGRNESSKYASFDEYLRDIKNSFSANKEMKDKWGTKGSFMDNFEKEKNGFYVGKY